MVTVALSLGTGGPALGAAGALGLPAGAASRRRCVRGRRAHRRTGVLRGSRADSSVPVGDEFLTAPPARYVA